MAWPPKARAGDGLHFYFCSVWISDLKCFFPHGSFVRMFLDVLGLFCNEFICLKQWQHKFSVEWGERSASLFLGFLIREYLFIHAEKGSCFTQCCFLFWVKSRPAWLLVSLWFFFFSVGPLNFHHLLHSSFATKLSRHEFPEAMPSQIATFKYFLVSFLSVP